MLLAVVISYLIVMVAVGIYLRKRVKGSNPLRNSPVFTGAGSAEEGIQRYLNVISYVSIYTGFPPTRE
jgi:Na+/proline symporter